MLTINRYLMTKYTIETLLATAGEVEIELLILDNGSTDTRIIDYCREKATVHLVEPVNIGVAKGFNKLFKQATGDFICTVGNDIIPTKNWLRDLVEYNQKIKDSGVGAIHCVLDKGRFNEDVGIYTTQAGLVYGISLFHKSLLKKIGGYNEDLSTYGYEDSEFCYRCITAGLLNYYVPMQSSVHIGHDVGGDSEYRKNKDLQLQAAHVKYQAAIKRITETGEFKIPLNEKNEI